MMSGFFTSRPQSDPIPVKPVAAVPLQKAVLCLDCETVSDGNTSCPACGNHSLMNLSKVLNRS